jgi:hypothetical protein
MRGEMAEGWEQYEWRYRLPWVEPFMPATAKPHWAGQPITDSTLLLVADQGIGDVVQFSRYLPWAAALCPNLAVHCIAPVLPLLRQIAPPSARLFLSWDECPPYSAFCPFSGLPRLHGTRIDTIPGGVAYLQADRARAARWRERLDALAPRGYRRIGLVWAGRPDHKNDSNRSATLADLAPLAALPGVALVALQKGQRAEQAGQYFGRAPLINLGAEVVGLDDAMAVLATLDLLVTVDTSLAHLAGAMGRPVWILLPYSPDWRWLLNRSDSPWYPTARLFRQTAPRQWKDVAEAIAGALRGI